MAAGEDGFLMKRTRMVAVVTTMPRMPNLVTILTSRSVFEDASVQRVQFSEKVLRMLRQSCDV
jgi:hypothetical protein